MSVSYDLALVEKALVAMRGALLGGGAPAGGWVLGQQEPDTNAWPYVDLEVQWNHAGATAEATVVETIHANTREEAIDLASRIATALHRRSFVAPGLRIVGHDLLTGPRVHRRALSTTAELTWRVSIAWAE